MVNLGDVSIYATAYYVLDELRRRGGSIAVSARAGGGTCFTVRLPAVRREGET